MEKKVLNVEAIQKKQQKQFILMYIIGLVAFIVVMVALNNNFNQDYRVTIDDQLLKAPQIINISDDNRRGKEMDELLVHYKDFSTKIDEMDLDKLDFDSTFSFSEEAFHYVDENYRYLANDNYLHLTRQNEDVYIASIEDEVVKIELFGEVYYLLEYTSSSISFKVDQKVYDIEKNNETYILKCDYLIDGYQVKEEIYDASWNLINITATNNNQKLIGYFLEDLGYTLSSDRDYIENDKNDTVISTKYNDDNSVLYTVINYNLTEDSSYNILLVDFNNRVLPFN